MASARVMVVAMIGRVVLCGVLVLASSACAPRWSNERLSRTEVASCAVRGGYESRSAFGAPICQFRYTDGGKACSGKSDCQGQCLDQREQASNRAVGAAASGFCTAEAYTPGCYAVIEAGKVKATLCVD